MRTVYALRAYNIFYFSLLAMFISFLPVYMAAKGLEPGDIGIIAGTGGFIGIFSQMLWGTISDRTKTIKRIMAIALAAAVAVGYALFQAESFAALLLFTSLMYFFLLPVDPLTESLNVQTARSKGISYGSIKTFGAVGYALASLAVGYAMQHWGESSLAACFVGAGAAGLLVLLSVADAPASGKPVAWSSLGRFLAVRRTLLFFLLVCLTAVPHRVNDNFIGVYITSLGGSAELVGQAWFLSSVSEIVMFALSYRWLREGRELFLISLSAACYVLRFALTAWLDEPRAIVFVQLLQSVTFPLFFAASIQYLHRIVPEEWRATGQTLLGILFFGLSGIVASYAGGWLFGQFGGPALFAAMAALSGAALLFSLALQRK